MLRNACYCKLKKQLDKLEREISQNYSEDTNLASKVNQLKNELDINTEKDTQLAEKINEISSGEINVPLVNENDIDNLFP